MDIISIIGVSLLVLAAAAGVVGYFKANVSRSTIDLYKQDNEALRSRLQTVEAEKVIDRARILALEGSVRSLQAIVTQAEAIASMRKVVDSIAAKVGA